MQELFSLGAVLGALAVGVISPGPSFVMVAKETVSLSRANGLAAALGMGLATQLSNPKTAVVYASVFAAFLPSHLSTHLAAALVVVIFVLETSWYAVVATLLSTAAPRRAYARCKAFVDRAAAIVMLGLGVKLIASAHRASAV